MNVERVQIFQRQLAQATNPQQMIILRFKLAMELLNSGRPDTALQQIQATEELLKKDNLHLSPQTVLDLRMFKATAMLRLGELENCVANHNAESCVFPLSPAAVHQRQRGSRGAIPLLLEQLKDSPRIFPPAGSSTLPT